MSSRPTLNELQDHGEFARRHIGPDPGELAAMLATIGVATLDDLMDRAVPERIRQRQPLDLPAGRSEREVLTDLRVLAQRWTQTSLPTNFKPTSSKVGADF